MADRRTLGDVPGGGPLDDGFEPPAVRGAGGAVQRPGSNCFQEWKAAMEDYRHPYSAFLNRSRREGAGHDVDLADPSRWRAGIGPQSA